MTREEKYISEAVPSRLPKCLQTYGAETVRTLPASETVPLIDIDERPQGQLCYERLGSSVAEERRDDAKDAKRLAKCERSALARKILPYYDETSSCWTETDGCGELVYETCADGSTFERYPHGFAVTR